MNIDRYRVHEYHILHNCTHFFSAFEISSCYFHLQIIFSYLKLKNVGLNVDMPTTSMHYEYIQSMKMDVYSYFRDIGNLFKMHIGEEFGKETGSINFSTHKVFCYGGQIETVQKENNC